MTKNIAIFDVDENQKVLIDRQFINNGNFTVICSEKPLNTQTAKQITDANGIGVFIRSRVTRELLDMLPELEVISTFSTGYDHIDTDECTRRGITVCNIPDYGDHTVAEYAFGLILALAKKFKPTFERAERGIFSRSGLMGLDLCGKTLGVIGTGRIGSNVVRMGHAFGMQVLGFDPVRNSVLEQKYKLKYVEIAELLLQSDIISLHVPYNESTHHMINSKTISLMKHDALIVNTSRGKVIDTPAIADAIRGGRIGGAALDTFEGEEVWLEEEFLRRDDLAEISLKQAMESFFILRSEKVILTPHNASRTKEAMERILVTGSENLKKFFRGNPSNAICS